MNIYVLAEKLHSRSCRLDHTDQCAWEYEISGWLKWNRGYKNVWDAPTHKRWLEEAKDFREDFML